MKGNRVSSSALKNSLDGGPSARDEAVTALFLAEIASSSTRPQQDTLNEPRTGSLAAMISTQFECVSQRLVCWRMGSYHGDVETRQIVKRWGPAEGD